MSNTEWLRRHYVDGPRSAESMENYVRNVAPQTKWLHLTDEPHPYAHTGLHMGDGTIDFEECASLLETHLRDETVTIIEVGDGHTDDGFKKLIEHDLPILRKLFK